MRRKSDQHSIHFFDGDEVVITGVRFLGCTLWTDFGLRTGDPGLIGRPVRQL